MRTSFAVLLLLASCAQTERSATAADAGSGAVSGHVRLIDAPDFADSAVLIADLAEQSRQAHRTPVVYMGAPWCEPCRYLHAAAADGGLDADFPDLDLLVFDDDRDAARLQRAGYVSKYIPLLAVPSPDG